MSAAKTSEHEASGLRDASRSQSRPRSSAPPTLDGAGTTVRPAIPVGASSRLLAIDVLRGVAVIAVAIAHLPFSWTGLSGAAPGGAALPNWFTAVTNYGTYGVNLFLVISGFCIHLQWARSLSFGGVSFLAFWRRRLRRLYPPYFVALLLSLAGMAGLAWLSGRRGSGVAPFFGYASDSQLLIDLLLLLVLAQNLNGASARVGNGPFWSLALEEQLYLLYFPFLEVRRRWGWRSALIVVAATTLAWRYIFAFSKEPPGFWYVVGPARWLEWVLGALAVEMHLGRVERPRWVSSPLALSVVLGAALLVAPPHIDATARLWEIPGATIVSDALFSFAAFILVNWCCSLEGSPTWRGRHVPRLLASVGLFSYSVYLVHQPVMMVVKRAAVGIHLRSVPALLTLRFVASIVAGYAFFRLVESFFLRRSVNRTRGDWIDASRSEQGG